MDKIDRIVGTACVRGPDVIKRSTSLPPADTGGYNFEESEKQMDTDGKNAP